MTNITITITEAELQALRHVIAVAHEGTVDNLTVDEELGMTLWSDTYDALEIIEDKFNRKEFEESEVARLADIYPEHSKTFIRKHVQKHIKETWNS